MRQVVDKWQEVVLGWHGLGSTSSQSKRSLPPKDETHDREIRRGVRAGELTLEERLREYPELRARFEEMLAIVENAAGDIVKADEAEQRVIEELRALGRSALQGGPSASNGVCKRRASSGGSDSQGKKTLLV